MAPESFEIAGCIYYGRLTSSNNALDVNYLFDTIRLLSKTTAFPCLVLLRLSVRVNHAQYASGGLFID